MHLYMLSITKFYMVSILTFLYFRVLSPLPDTALKPWLSNLRKHFDFYD